MAFPLGKAVKLVTRLGVELMSLSLARRRAVRGFRSGLEEMGVPPRVVAELVAQFPRFEMGTTGLVPPLGPSGGRVAPLGQVVSSVGRDAPVVEVSGVATFVATPLLVAGLVAS